MAPSRLAGRGRRGYEQRSMKNPSRWLLRLPLAALTVLALGACSAETGETGEEEELGESEDLITGKDTAGIVAGSPEEESILIIANDRALTDARFKNEIKATATVRKSLFAFRNGPTADPADDGYVSTLAELDKLAGTTKLFYSRVTTFARANGYMDTGPYVAPDKGLFEIPDDLGRPPTSNDVRVVRGLDGRTPDEAFAIVRSRSFGYVHPQNERLLRDTFNISFKAFNIAVANFFANGSPPQRFFKSVMPAQVRVLGLLRQLTPVALEVTSPDGRVRYFMNTTGTYQEVAKPTQRVIMRAAVSLDDNGVRVFYPGWSQSNLKAPTSSVVEGGGG